MNRFVPFLALGTVAVLGLIGTRGEAKVPSIPTVKPAEADGSVRVNAALERTQLLAGAQGEVFARIALQGVDAPAKQERMPVSVTLVIDTSGSMSGDKIRSARESAVAVIDQLLEGDQVSVVTFSSGARVLVDRVHIGSPDARKARDLVRGLGANGSTDMFGGLAVGGRQARALFGDARTNRIVLLSDGQPDSQNGLDGQVRALAKDGILTTTIGVGRDYNEDLMAKLADAGLANYYFVENPAQMAGIFAKELRALGAVVAKEAVVTIGLGKGVVIDEVYGYDVSRGDGVVAIPVGDVYAGRTTDILAKVRVPATRTPAGVVAELIDVKVTYHDALAGVARRTHRQLAATFTHDRDAVTASAVPDVVEKAQKVRAAEAMAEASAAFARGKRDEGRRILQAQKAEVKAYAASVSGTAFESQAEGLAGDLDAFDDEMAAPAADAKVSSKKMKARARTLMKH